MFCAAICGSRRTPKLLGGSGLGSCMKCTDPYFTRMFFVAIEAVKRILNAKYSFYTQRRIEKQNEINLIGYLVTIRARE